MFEPTTKGTTMLATKAITKQHPTPFTRWSARISMNGSCPQVSREPRPPPEGVIVAKPNGGGRQGLALMALVLAVVLPTAPAAARPERSPLSGCLICIELNPLTMREPTISIFSPAIVTAFSGS